MKFSYKKLIAFCMLVLSASMQPVMAFDPCDFDDFDFEIEPIDPDELVVAALKSIVQRPLWSRTNIPNGRDALYLMPYKIATLERGGIVSNFFFNATNRMPLTFDSLFNTTCIDIALEGIVGLLADSGDACQVLQITPLLKKITLQERKVGDLIQAGFILGPIIIQVNTSLQLTERNFWLNQADRTTISSIVGRVFPDGDVTFDESDLVRYRFGLGDTRLKVGVNVVNRQSAQVDIGFEGIFPTSRFSSANRLDLEQSTDPSDFLAVLLSRLQKAVLRPKLGNGGHFGLGIYLESKVSLYDDDIYVWNRFSYDNFFTARQDRLILFRPIIAPDDLTTDNLNEFLQQYLFPPVFNVSVRPGSITNIVTGVDVKCGPVRCTVGHDFYYQRSERFTAIRDQSAPPANLLEERATAPQAFQHKLFSDVVGTWKGKKYDILAGIGGDVTLASQGFGRDWTVYGKIGILF